MAHLDHVEWDQWYYIPPKATIEVVFGNFTNIFLISEFRIIWVCIIKNEVHQEINKECYFHQEDKRSVLWVSSSISCIVGVDEAADDAQEIDDLVPNEIGRTPMVNDESANQLWRVEVIAVILDLDIDILLRKTIVKVISNHRSLVHILL